MIHLLFLLPLELAAAPSIAAALPPPPAHFQHKLECSGPEQASVDHPFALRCAVSPGTPAANVVLYFRPVGAQDFTAAPTLPAPRGWFVASLCSHDVGPGPLQYYFEARDPGGKVVAASGDEESPSVLVVEGPSAPPPVRLAAVAPGPAAHATSPHAAIADDDDPLAAVKRAQAKSHSDDLRARRRQLGPFVGGSIGVGFGRFGDRTLDYRSDLASDPDFGASGLPLWLPEVGWQVTDTLALSAQLRWQSIDPSGAGDGRAGSPAKQSWAVLARGQYQFGEGRLQPFVSGNLGFGDGFRIVVPARGSLLRDDTVRGGPFLVGPGAGLLFHINPHVALAGEVRGLAGLPNFAVVADLTGGMQIAF